MLGVKRELVEVDGEVSVNLTMTSYIDGMVKAFEDFDRPTRVNTPFPKHTPRHISKFNVIDDE